MIEETTKNPMIIQIRGRDEVRYGVGQRAVASWSSSALSTYMCSVSSHFCNIMNLNTNGLNSLVKDKVIFNTFMMKNVTQRCAMHIISILQKAFIREL